MRTKVVKWICIAALLVLAILWRSSSNSWTFAAAWLVWAGAAVVSVQAARVHRSVWAGVFLAMCLLFNPFVPVSASPSSFLVLYSVCLAMFLISLSALNTSPRLSIASITDRTPGSESL